ncbi:hypothetical protein C8Q78DRAFT_480940 [Trametes maxima]|nr:hypothetical protein C8Q78DRAFT_480940 [Trametes maxima]
MQNYSNPDVFFCPLYNPPGVSDPITAILSGESERWCPSPYSTPNVSRAASPRNASSPSTPRSSPSSPFSYSSPPSSSSSSSSPSASRPTSPEGGRKLQKYRRLCAQTGKPLLDFVAEVEGRRIVHEKRKQLKSSQSTRNPSGRAGSDGC